MRIYEIHFGFKKETRNGKCPCDHSRVIAIPDKAEPIDYLAKSFTSISKDDLEIGEIREIINGCVFYYGPYKEF